MGGGLMQLVAYGAQDIYLTGNPQITFFKVVYRRHTNFAMESIEQTFNGAAKLGQKFSCTISRNGDLLHKIYLEVDLNGDVNASTSRYGHQMINYVEVEIGGQCIDKHYGEWMDIWAQLSSSSEQWTKLDRVVGGDLQNASSNSKLYVPLQFWFCRNPGLALPLIALQYHEVKLNVQFNTFASIRMNQDVSATTAGSATNGGDAAPTGLNIDQCCVFCDYIFLDTDERRRFAQVSHEYLIEQVQFSNALTQASGDDQHELRFNHPVKELVWTVQRASRAPFNYFSTNTGVETDMVDSALLQLNGHDRMKKRDGTYFRCVQPLQHHTGGHNQEDGNAAGTAVDPLGGMYCYSFGLKPEEHQPSGTCNFSRIDNAVLALDAAAAGTLKVYAVNYNVLRIMSGMGGLAYSN